MFELLTFLKHSSESTYHILIFSGELSLNHSTIRLFFGNTVFLTIIYIIVNVKLAE
jgi:hypothetical protein